MDCAQNPPSTKSCGLYPSLCNDESQPHSVPSVDSTPREYVENEGWKLQILVWTKLLPPITALHMSHLRGHKMSI